MLKQNFYKLYQLDKTTWVNEMNSWNIGNEKFLN